MLTYNTKLEHLILPEYGRNVQKMVEHCMTLPDKEMRNACAATIVRSITNLLPEIKNSPKEIAKLWDHIAIISKFKLDIDYPHEIIEESALYRRPELVHYGHSNTRLKHYGHLVEVMIEQCAQMEESADRDAMIADVACHMKKTLVMATGDNIEDSRIFNDIAMISHGAIMLKPEMLTLPEYKHIPQPTNNKKKRKK